MQAQELLHSLIEDIEHLAQTKTVVGDPMTIGDTTVVPIIRLSVGFGAGGGHGSGGDKSATGEGDGGGGGGGVRMEPAAFIVTRGDEFSIMAAPGKRGAMAELFEHAPDLVEKIVRATRSEEAETEKEAAPVG